MYEIIGLQPEDFPDEIERFYDDPRLLIVDLNRLRRQFPENVFSVLKDEAPYDEARLTADVQSFEIQMHMKDSDKVPSGFRQGWGTERDDFAVGDHGPTRVWRPPNPDDDN